MLPYSSKNFPIPHEANPLCLDVLSVLRGDLGVDSSVVMFIVIEHVDIACIHLKSAYFGIVLLDDAGQLVGTSLGCYEVLFGEGSAPADSGCQSECNSLSGGHEFFISTYPNDSFG